LLSDEREVFFQAADVTVLQKFANLETEGGVLYYTISKLLMFVYYEGNQH